ncbi:MAG: hypothetical protein HYZ48_01760 [Chlamydiales bacterium]|nr:hypothetical protein [Chlamydiales bacterium]
MRLNIKSSTGFIFIFLFICIGFLSGCGGKKGYKRPTSDDFESLTGKDLPAWKYVQTKEDFEHLLFFKALYEGKKKHLGVLTDACRIPQIIHFVWVGERPFPRESVENIRTWMAHHPDWKFQFWTDRKRPVPIPGIELCYIKDLNLIQLAPCLAKTDSPAEKSDLLRLEILYQKGGIYVDHDVKCFKSFDPLNRAYDFYCGIDMPFQSSLASCIYTTNNLIGVKPFHPIILRSMELLAQNFDAIGEDYPGSDRDCVLNRVLHRTFWLFGQAVKEMHSQFENRDIVFPAYYFDAPCDELALWARHQYAGTWHETESVFEKMVRQRLMYLSKKSNKMLLLIGAVSFLNLLGFFLVFRALRKYGQRT